MRKNKFSTSLIILSASILFASCIPMNLFVTSVSSKIVSFKDPAYRDAAFSRILVRADYDKLDEMKKVESELVFLLNKEGMYAVANSTILPPIRNYTEEEKKECYKS